MKPEKKVKEKKVTKKKKNNVVISGIVAVVLFAAIAYVALSSDPDNPVDTPEKPRTLKEVRAFIDEKYSSRPELGTNTPPVVDGYVPILTPRTADKLPSYAYTNAMTLRAYRYATEHPEVLEQIPCYCGCGDHADHRSVRDCYIRDDGTYDEHASFCDVCVGIAITAQDFLPDGIPTLSTASAVTGVDLSQLSLPDNFKSLEEGLKLTPAGANRAYFINNKMLMGTELESQYLSGMSREDGFYGKPLMGMYSADFSPTSWIEIHDIGYDSTKDPSLKAKLEQGMKNTVYTRPMVYGHSSNVDNVLKLMADPESMATSYQTYKPLLDAVDYSDTGIASVMTESTKFSDMNYWSLKPEPGSIELVMAYHITDSKSIPAALDKYDPEIRGNILIIKVTGDLETVNNEKDNIEAAVR
jgi:hypothetical protein